MKASAARESIPRPLGKRFWTPEEFEGFAREAYELGFLVVASSPLTRSSHNADADFEKLRAARERRKREDEASA